MPGLDVLRGLAILMVLVYHGLAPFRDTPSIPHWVAVTLWSTYHGVHLFFILSGFLITGILLNDRKEPSYLRNFYRRRILRIFPAYLTILTLLALMHSITLRYLGVCLLFFCNMTGIFGLNAEYGPLWSLSVEEQFYLVWPLTVLKLSLRNLAILCATLILATPLLRFALLQGPPAFHDISFKTWVLLDFFAAGSLLAIGTRQGSFRPYLRRLVVPIILAGALLFSLLYWLHRILAQNLLQAMALEPWLLLFTGLTLLASLNPRIVSTTIARPFVFLARISYGLYLYHVFLFQLVAKHWPASLPAHAGLPWLQFVVATSLSIAVAYVSRITLEAYFLHRGTQRQWA